MHSDHVNSFTRIIWGPIRTPSPKFFTVGSCSPLLCRQVRLHMRQCHMFSERLLGVALIGPWRASQLHRERPSCCGTSTFGSPGETPLTVIAITEMETSVPHMAIVNASRQRLADLPFPMFSIGSYMHTFVNHDPLELHSLGEEEQMCGEKS